MRVKTYSDTIALRGEVSRRPKDLMKDGPMGSLTPQDVGGILNHVHVLSVFGGSLTVRGGEERVIAFTIDIHVHLMTGSVNSGLGYWIVNERTLLYTLLGADTSLEVDGLGEFELQRGQRGYLYSGTDSVLTER